MAQQIITEPPMYEPTFNPETNSYYDENPYFKNQRNCIQMKCGCPTGTVFSGWGQFNNHTKSKAHCLYVKDFGRNTDEIESLKKEIATLSNSLDKCKAENDNLKNIVEDQKNDIAMLNNIRQTFINLMRP